MNLVANLLYTDGASVDKTGEVNWEYQVVGEGLSFAGYVLDSVGPEGFCVPLKKGYFQAIARYRDLEYATVD